jgi:hypothetical protein
MCGRFLQKVDGFCKVLKSGLFSQLELQGGSFFQLLHNKKGWHRAQPTMKRAFFGLHDGL